MLRAENVSFAYGRRRAVDAVSVDVEPGQVLAILGPNGAGKTSLFRLLSGAETPAEGRVTLDGRPLADYPARELATRRAVLPQISQLGFNFTVREVVEMGRLPHVDAGDADTGEDIVAQAMACADVTTFAARHYMSLSGGERQRVHLARCLAQVWPEPDAPSGCLLLDEPTNNLDIAHQHLCLREARRLADAGAAVACILHDFNLALAYADRCAVLDHGRLRASGDISELTVEVVRDVFQVQAVETGTGRERALLTRPWSDS